MIETVNDELKKMCQLEHSSHHSVRNILTNLIGILLIHSLTKIQ
jgi:hypothetical protein